MDQTCFLCGSSILFYIQSRELHEGYYWPKILKLTHIWKFFPVGLNADVVCLYMPGCKYAFIDEKCVGKCRIFNIITKGRENV